MKVKEFLKELNNLDPESELTINKDSKENYFVVAGTGKFLSEEEVVKIGLLVNKLQLCPPDGILPDNSERIKITREIYSSLNEFAEKHKLPAMKVGWHYGFDSKTNEILKNKTTVEAGA